MKRLCDKNIDELNTKVNDLNKLLENYKNKNAELENKNLILRQDNEKLRLILQEKENLSMVLQEKNDVEIKCNEANNAEINNLKTNLENIIVVLKTLFNKETQIYENRNNFLNKLSSLDMRRKIQENRNVNYYDYGNINKSDELKYMNNKKKSNLNNNNNFDI